MSWSFLALSPGERAALDHALRDDVEWCSFPVYASDSEKSDPLERALIKQRDARRPMAIGPVRTATFLAP